MRPPTHAATASQPTFDFALNQAKQLQPLVQAAARLLLRPLLWQRQLHGAACGGDELRQGGGSWEGQSRCEPTSERDWGQPREHGIATAPAMCAAAAAQLE